jgi:hypothetical protein
MNTTTQASQTLSQMINTLNKMLGEADDRLSQIAGEASEAAKKDALLIAYANIDKQMEILKAQLARAYSIASN